VQGRECQGISKDTRFGLPDLEATSFQRQGRPDRLGQHSIAALERSTNAEIPSANTKGDRVSTGLNDRLHADRS
jgi:hypothetical protein